MKPAERLPPAVFAAFVAVALALRLPRLDTGLWYDEIWTLVDFGGLPFGTLLTTYGSDNNHPLFTILAWISIHVFGPSTWALRLPALVFGVASVAMLLRLASRLAPRGEALAATALLTVSYHHVWFSQNARGYTALLFFSLAATDGLVRLLEGDRRAFIPYGVSIALATYTHMTGVFVAMAHGIVLLMLLARREPAARPLLYGLAAGTIGSLLLHAPILREMIEFLFLRRPQINVKSEWVSPWWTIRAVALSLGAGLIPGMIALAGGAAVLIAGVAGWWRANARLTVAFLAPGMIGAAVMVGLGRNLWPRFFFFLAGFLLLIIVRGLSILARLLARFAPFDLRRPADRALFSAGVTVMLLGFLAILPRAYLPKQDFVGARAYVDQVRQPGQVIMTAGLTDLPYQRWLKTSYVSIDSVTALDRALSGTAGGYLLSTLPTYLESRLPELAAEVSRRGTEVKRFPGTLGGGDVVVIRFQATP